MHEAQCGQRSTGGGTAVRLPAMPITSESAVTIRPFFLRKCTPVGMERVAARLCRLSHRKVKLGPAFSHWSPESASPTVSNQRKHHGLLRPIRGDDATFAPLQGPLKLSPRPSRLSSDAEEKEVITVELLLPPAPRHPLPSGSVADCFPAVSNASSFTKHRNASGGGGAHEICKGKNPGPWMSRCGRSSRKDRAVYVLIFVLSWMLDF
ncbi:hypothetical protein B296_00014602 [Ensete ventricosum]|uniref:Uncharacterized protein n=1 Tax=Ensete ventricosum TaxID=4639 RepID=A0A427B267_ENSVE|nr:hypothetical protein B296_00014602 [Ensete ventricosum]